MDVGQWALAGDTGSADPGLGGDGPVRADARRAAVQFPATPADRTSAWEEADVTIRAEQWTDLVLPDAPVNAPSFSVLAVFDPR